MLPGEEGKHKVASSGVLLRGMGKSRGCSPARLLLYGLFGNSNSRGQEQQKLKFDQDSPVYNRLLRTPRWHLNRARETLFWGSGIPERGSKTLLSSTSISSSFQAFFSVESYAILTRFGRLLFPISPSLNSIPSMGRD